MEPHDGPGQPSGESGIGNCPPAAGPGPSPAHVGPGGRPLREGGGAASVHTLDLDLLLVDHSAAATLNQTSAEPICFVTLGLIQGALFWAAGQEADMEEIACKAAGAPACEFKIKPGVSSK